jgi:glycosyltransferase involved in cell wall biosynthesis
MSSMPYRFGNPFSPKMVRDLSKMGFDILHVHSPFASSVLAREVSIVSKKRMPTVLTYHTKYDADIDRYLDNPRLNRLARKFVRSNICRADEVWAVSEGTKESLKKIGYDGEVIVMPNGTDFKRGRAPEGEIAEINRIYNTANEELVFLYCGRMMWYKNIKIILDSLKILSENGIKYKTFFVGDGPDRPSIEKYARDLGIYNNMIFTGSILDRERVRAFFSRADLFLFPSTYDTSGLVVKEAAACGCASVLIKGSCAAEGVEDGVSGILSERETAKFFSKAIMNVLSAPEKIKIIGKTAEEKVYFSWADSIDMAVRRYEKVIENHKKRTK